ncbi:MAG TPA: hypothetical protein VKA84_04500, partial [Gemmatimonadaceae bacterium]|nr:hypothetical protein [Gemmatimonadaceae bacterium]
MRIAVAAVVVAMVIVLVQSLRRDGPAALAAWRAAHVRWSWVAASIACALAGHGAFVFGWRRLLMDAGVPAPLWQLLRIFLVSNLGRYLPGGKAWQMAIVGAMAAERQLPAGMVAASSLLQGVVGVVVGLVVLFVAGGAAVGVRTVWLVLPIAAVAGLLAGPAILRSLPRVNAPIARRVPGIASVTAATMWTLTWTSAASWIMWGIALWALATALLSEASAPVTAYVAAWAGS